MHYLPAESVTNTITEKVETIPIHLEEITTAEIGITLFQNIGKDLLFRGTFVFIVAIKAQSISIINAHK